MATREELLALLLSRRRNYSIRPVAPGPAPSWLSWLQDSTRLTPARGAARHELIAAMVQKPLRTLPSAFVPGGRWSQFRSLFRQGWGCEREESGGLRFGASAASVLFNVFFATMLVWLTYLRFMAVQEAPEETVRIRITGFGTPDTGGGQAPVDGDVQPSGSAASSAQEGAVRERASAAVPSINAPAASQTEENLAEAAINQPLQVTESDAEPEGFQLPPAREIANMVDAARELPPPSMPSETALPTPAPIPSVRSLAVPERDTTVRVPQLATPTRELPITPEPAPQVRIRELAVQPPGAQIRIAETSTRALPSVPAASVNSGQATPVSAGTSVRVPATSTAGLPEARGRAPTPGQQAPASGMGEDARTADGGWSSPRRNDDLGAGDRNRAGAASGGDRGNPAGQGGSGLFDAEGRPRLADDRFQSRFPDPYKEGAWLKRPSLGYRGTMFDGIWRPPETLLQEILRSAMESGTKHIDIPLPGGKVKIRCVVSVLALGGGCGPIPGKEGMHDQPARARASPDVPFKPQLFESQRDLSSPKPDGGAAKEMQADESGMPNPQ